MTTDSGKVHRRSKLKKNRCVKIHEKKINKSVNVLLLLDNLKKENAVDRTNLKRIIYALCVLKPIVSNINTIHTRTRKFSTTFLKVTFLKSALSVTMKRLSSKCFFYGRLPPREKYLNINWEGIEVHLTDERYFTCHAIQYTSRSIYPYT